MKINVAHVRQAIGEGQSFRFAATTGSLFPDLEPFWIVGPLQIQGEVVNKGEFLTVSGTIFASTAQICNRCLTEFSEEIAVPFCETYREAASSGAVDSEDEQSYYYGDEIDIADLIHETLILAEPLKALCKIECRGLCGKCGANLNVTSCTCDQRTIDPRLAGLQKLLERD